MFRGVQHINMDAKGRLAMPAKYRERLLKDCEGQLVATIDINVKSKCLSIYPLPAWEDLEEQVDALPTTGRPATVSWKRMIMGHASELELDGNGRVLLPASLRDYAQLEKKLVLVGLGNKLELWAEDNWLNEREKSLSEMSGDEPWPEELLNLSL
jgi:MraZ protein